MADPNTPTQISYDGDYGYKTVFESVGIYLGGLRFYVSKTKEERRLRDEMVFLVKDMYTLCPITIKIKEKSGSSIFELKKYESK